MESRQNKATTNRPEGDRLIEGPVVQCDLEDAVLQLRNEPGWHERDRSALTLFKSGPLTAVLVGLRENAQMTTLEPDNLMTLQVLSGKLELEAAQQKFTLEQGQFMALNEKVPYKLQALDDSFFVLTVVRPNE